MDLKKIFSPKRVLFIVLFTAMVFIGMRINFSPVLGVENQFFTLFQFFGPIAGAFLGPVYGVITVLGAELADFFIAGEAWSVINLIRLTPMLFASYYFGTKKKHTLLIPVLAGLAYLMHPVGRQAWAYSLFWLIPIAVKVLPEKFDNIIGKSLGATFTAHAVGSAAFVWSIQTTPDLWISLLPIVIVERTLFTAGIAASYYTMNAVLHTLIEKFSWKIPQDILHLDKDKAMA